MVLLRRGLRTRVRRARGALNRTEGTASILEIARPCTRPRGAQSRVINERMTRMLRMGQRTMRASTGRAGDCFCLLDRAGTVGRSSYCPLPYSWRSSNLFSFDDGSVRPYDVHAAHMTLATFRHPTKNVLRISILRDLLEADEVEMQPDELPVWSFDTTSRS